MVYSHLESFHNKSSFYFYFKQFWVVQKLAKINHKKNAKTIFILGFSVNTLCNIILNNLLIKFLNEIISFVYNYKRKH